MIHNRMRNIPKGQIYLVSDMQGNAKGDLPHRQNLQVKSTNTQVKNMYISVNMPKAPKNV